MDTQLQLSIFDLLDQDRDTLERAQRLIDRARTAAEARAWACTLLDSGGQR